MKKISLLAIVVFLNHSLHAQQSAELRAKSESVFNMLIRYYNAVQADSLSKLYTSDAYWTTNSILSMQKDFGKIVSYKYMGPFNNEVDRKGNLCVYFKTTFSKPAAGYDAVVFKGKTAHAMCICLDENRKIYGERFLTSSPATDSLIANY